MNQEEKRELYAKLDVLKKDVAELRKQLNTLNAQKEAAFGKKNEFSNKIRALITDIKQSRSIRNEFTKEVADSKERRHQFHDELRQKIEEAKRLNKERAEITKKHKIQGDPARLKEEIDHLEQRIETEGLSFEKEQKLMKEIKEKRHIYEGAKKVSTVFDRLHEINKDIERLKQKSDEAHRKVQHKATASQEKHQELIETSKEIDDLRAKEKEYFNQSLDLKKQCSELNTNLKQKLTEMNALHEQLEGVKQEGRVETKRRQELTIREMQRLVEEKMRRGEKLTNEDLLVMQGAQ